jgi:hypothetical protein
MKAATVGAIALAGVAMAAPAQAATAQPMSYHSGSAGCFNWSWSDGITSTTVYYHNTCGHTELIRIIWNENSTTQHSKVITVGAGAKGHDKEDGSVRSIEDWGH